MMRLTIANLALALAGSASAHSTMHSVFVNGVDQGDGRNVYIRSPPNNSPVKDLASPDLVCNVNGGKEVSSFVKAAAGDTLTFEWYHNTRGDDIIDGSHKGPIITYIAPYTSANGVGSIWTKIAEEGYDSASGLWAVDKLIANGGKKEFALPANLAAGKYLIRQEIIAHHESNDAFSANPARGAQFYPSCVQVEVTGSGSAVPDQNFNFNTGYTYSDPGIVFNIYTSFSSYSIPGPKVWDAASTSPGSGSPSATAPGTTITLISSAAPIATPTTTSTPDSPVITETPAPTVAPTTLATSVRPTSSSSSAAAPVPTTTPTTGRPRPTVRPCPGSRGRRVRKH